jgi:hypothetical protein
MIYCAVTDPTKRSEMLDLFPLEGDPTKEERELMLRREKIIDEETALQTVDYWANFDKMMQEKFKNA